MARHDVFISYAHIDNDPEYPDQQGWVSVFQSALGKRLSRELGRVAQIFWDQRELDGNRFFDETIRAACAEATVMLSVVSPRYVVSPSCRNEVDYFSQVSAKNGDRSRLISVRKTPIPEQLLPEISPLLARTLSDTLGYQFYDHDERGVRREFHIYDAELRPRFDRRLDELVQDIARYLRDSLGQTRPSWTPVASTSRPPTPLPPTPLPPRTPAPVSDAPVLNPAWDAVFLAATGSDVRHLRDALHLELSDRGVKVVAPSAWGEDSDSVTEELRAALSGVGLSVHIVGGAAGSQPEGCELPLPEFQFDCMQEHVAKRDDERPLLRIVWLCPGVEPKTERQRAFHAKLRAYDAWRDEDELLTGSHEELSERVTKKLAALAAKHERRLRALREQSASSERPRNEHESFPPGGVPRKIYVISEPEDHERAAVIERALQSRNLEVLSASEITLDAETEQEREQQHQEYLEKSDAFVIYHGHSKFRWVRAQADEARKIAGRTGRTDAKGAVYVAQPLDGRKATYELVGIERCDESQSEPDRVLEKFVERVSGTLPHGGQSG